jgi:hypothetical protein
MTYQPLLPQRQWEDVRATNLSSQFGQQSEGDSRAEPSSSLKLKSGDEGRSKDGLDHAPVVVNHLTQTDLSNVKPLPFIAAPNQNQVIAAQAKEARRAQIPLRPYAEAPQSDDIQIHIGRIEVVAVQQPEPRQTPPPVRKGLTLDDYLSRRNGRIG